MKAIVISDTHNKHRDLNRYLTNEEYIYDVDAIIHCGDASVDKNPYVNEHEMHDFLEWYSDLNIPNKLYIPGNHDSSIQAGLIKNTDYLDIDFLIHRHINIEGVKIFGSPYTPSFGVGWVYNVERSKLHDYWSEIPSDTEILITHGPPKGILDLTYQYSNTFKAVGCKALLARVFELSELQYHLFGHVHDEKNIINTGHRIINNTIFINASITDLNYNTINPPIKIEI